MTTPTSPRHSSQAGLAALRHGAAVVLTPQSVVGMVPTPTEQAWRHPSDTENAMTAEHPDSSTDHARPHYTVDREDFNRNGLHAVLTPSPEWWEHLVAAERRAQRVKWGDEHDREHGVDHLLTLAQDYGRRGKAVKAAALVQAARDLLAETTTAEPAEAAVRADIAEALWGRAATTRSPAAAFELRAAAKAITEGGRP